MPNEIETESKTLCESCENEITGGESCETPDGELYCQDCFDESFAFCGECDDTIHRDNVYSCDDHENNTYCQNCFDNHQDNYHNDNEPVGDIYRHPQNNLKLHSKLTGDILKSPRLFGIEIETIAPDRNETYIAIDKLPATIGIASDGSISHNGLEFQTPKLAGRAGENYIKNVCATLQLHDFKIDKSCGLHLHLNAPEIAENHHKLARLWLFYLVYEDIITGFLPITRRRNNFCKPIRHAFHIEEIMNSASVEELEQIWYRQTSRTQIDNYKSEHHHDSRYYGLNLHVLLAEQHAEIRYHSGTINAEKILQWTRLHQTIFDTIANNVVSHGGFTNDVYNTAFEIDENKKLKKFFAFLDMPAASVDYFMKRRAQFMAEPVSESESGKLSTLIPERQPEINPAEFMRRPIPSANEAEREAVLNHVTSVTTT